MATIDSSYHSIPTAEKADYSETAVGPEKPDGFKLYKRRWLILLLFMLFSAFNTWQWIQYTIVSNVIQKYYNVDNYAVDWTSMLYMIGYVPLAFPAAVFINKKGLRLSILTGSTMNAIGTWLKVLALDRSRYWLLMVGHTFGAVAQVFMLSVPPTLAFYWFGANEISTACALGVFGNQLGVAVSFLVNPLLVRNHEDVEDIGRDLKVASYGLAVASTTVAVFVLIMFRDAPPTPPSPAALARSESDSNSVRTTMRNLKGQTNFLLLIVSFTLCFSVLNAISTLINPIILLYFENGEAIGGRVGLLLVVGGMTGAVIIGILLDKTHKFKETTLGLSGFFTITMATYTFVVRLSNEPALYACTWFLGMSSGAYIPVGMDFMAELTYPEPESLTATLLMVVGQTFSVPVTMLYGWEVNTLGDLTANLTMVAILAVGVGFTVFIKSDLRRLAASTVTKPGEKLIKMGA